MQLQDETGIIYIFLFGVAYIRDFTVSIAYTISWDHDIETFSISKRVSIAGCEPLSNQQRFAYVH